MREHHALRPAGGAAGVEQPRRIGRRNSHRLGECIVAEQARVFRIAEFDHAFERGTSDRARCKFGPPMVIHKYPARRAMPEDVRKFVGVQLAVDRYDAQTCVPAGENHFDVFDAIPGDDGDTITGHQPRRTQAGRKLRYPQSHFAVRGADALARRERRQRRVGTGAVQQRRGEIVRGRCDH